LNARLDWQGDEARREVHRAVVGFLHASCIEIQNRAKELLSVAGTGRRGRRRVYGANPSTPGNPPAKQTGRLRASVTYEVDETRMVGRVGTNVLYGLFLELGTSRMAARPWLRRALAESEDKIRTMARTLFRR
jgi:phage gpG-like protein